MIVMTASSFPLYANFCIPFPVFSYQLKALVTVEDYNMVTISSNHLIRKSKRMEGNAWKYGGEGRVVLEGHFEVRP
jgi:hypothetical protein